jgi:DNA-binding response OmpR family regulator
VVNRLTVSRFHARIEFNGMRFVVQDLESANGTFVNEHAIRQPTVLRDQDIIGLGSPTPLLRFFDVDPTQVMQRRTLTYDERAMTFHFLHTPLKLTPVQFRLLLHLYQHAGEVCTRESCALAVWGREYEPGMDADALDQVVSSLRSALRKIEPTANLIETRRALGFILLDA